MGATLDYANVAGLSRTQAARDAEAARWASEFRQLHVSDAAAAQPHLEAPAAVASASQQPWFRDFLSQPQSPPSTLPSQKQPLAPGRPTTSGLYAGPIAPLSLFPYGTSVQSNLGPSQYAILQPEEIFDEAAFERAFDAVGTALDLRDAEAAPEAPRVIAGPQTADGDRDISGLVAPEPQTAAVVAEVPDATRGQPDRVRELHKQDYGGDTDISTVKIGSDTISKADETQPDDSKARDALARTAGSLLEKVQDDRSQKFRNSAFLGLMRQLRDGEAIVKDDDIVRVY
jgi:hypothetical protein